MKLARNWDAASFIFLFEVKSVKVQARFSNWLSYTIKKLL